MSKHDNIYNILGKLASLAPAAPKQESVLKQLSESAMPAPTEPQGLKARLAARLEEAKAAEKEPEGTYSKKRFETDGQRVARLAKEKRQAEKDKVKEGQEVDEELLMPKEKKFAALAEPKNKITYADKIAGAKKDDKKKKDVKEGEFQSGPNKSDVPAFQRKAAAAPGDQSWKTTTQDLDAEATKSPTSSAGLAKAKERLGMGQQVYDENNAHSSLPGTRKVSPEEHSEYDAAAHEIRKWMRKRGWDPKSEFKPAMKYIIDNLDSEHDDTLTDDVKMAACTCHKHHQGIVDEAFPTVAGARAEAEKSKGTGKFDSKKTGTGTQYTRKSDTFSDDGDSEEKSTSDGPKKRGRPAKAKGPERVTAKAYKHKGGRVAEAINLETYVEDTMAEIEALFIIEKDMGKHNNATTGFKAVAKKAGGGEKGQRIAGAQFQKMKKAGQLEESILVENTLQSIVRKFGKEVREFAEGGDIDNDLFEALYDYYFDDMPYGVKKSRDGDPYEWIGDHFHEAIQNGDVEINETKVGHKDLDELAALAGIGGGQQIADEGNEFSGARAAAIRAGKSDFTVGGKTFSVTDASDEIHESQCNMTAEGQMCPVHGMVECGGGMAMGGMMEDAKPDFLDVDDDGDEKESFKKAVSDAEDDDKEDLDECGVPVQMGGMGGEAESGMNINTSMDTKTGRKSVTVSAEGEAAEQLAAMLKMAGLGGGSAPQEKHVEVVVGRAGGDEEVAEEYANEPNTETASTDAILSQGNDLNKPKGQYKHSYKGSDNPMAMKEDKLFRLLSAMKTR